MGLPMWCPLRRCLQFHQRLDRLRVARLSQSPAQISRAHQTLEKDNLIKTRLLEAENAEKERENENRRESKEFKGNFEPNRKELGKELDQNKVLEEMLKYNELKLKRFYQEKYQKYIESTKK